jgi:hypothetical protein
LGRTAGILKVSINYSFFIETFCLFLSPFQSEFQTDSLPSWLYDEENVMNGTILGTTDSENTSIDSIIVPDVLSQ